MELSPQRADQRARTQKRIRMNALNRKGDALARARFNPLISPEAVAAMEKDYETQVAKWKTKHPDWWK